MCLSPRVFSPPLQFLFNLGNMQRLRQRQMCNFFSALLLAHGVAITPGTY